MELDDYKALLIVGCGFFVNWRTKFANKLLYSVFRSASSVVSHESNEDIGVLGDEPVPDKTRHFAVLIPGWEVNRDCTTNLASQPLRHSVPAFRTSTRDDLVAFLVNHVEGLEEFVVVVICVPATRADYSDCFQDFPVRFQKRLAAPKPAMKNVHARMNKLKVNAASLAFANSSELYFVESLWVVLYFEQNLVLH